MKKSKCRLRTISMMVLIAEEKMPAVSALFLVMLAALIRSSCGISCYVCRSKSEPACDDPFNRNSSGVHTLSCKSNACVKAKGRAKGKQSITVLRPAWRLYVLSLLLHIIASFLPLCDCYCEISVVLFDTIGRRSRRQSKPTG